MCTDRVRINSVDVGLIDRVTVVWSVYIGNKSGVAAVAPCGLREFERRLRKKPSCEYMWQYRNFANSIDD